MTDDVTARTCLIVNPNAGRKAGLTTNAFGVDEARDLLARHGIDAEIWCTERPGHATDPGAHRPLDERYNLVIAAGGDGTVEEVAEGLVGTAVVLGVLPLGSVMNIARMLGIPRDLEAAAEVIKDRRVAWIDVGRATTQARSSVLHRGGRRSASMPACSPTSTRSTGQLATRSDHC